MADKSVSIDLIIKSSEAASSLKEVKQSLKDIKDAMIGAGEGTTEFNKLAAAAGQLKDKVDDSNEAINAMNPNKFQAVASFAGAAAGGISAVTGAMGLFGEQSEEVTKTLAKVQSAMALSQGLAAISELPKAWNNLKAAMASTEIVQKLVTIGTRLWNAALLANPIGLIIAGVAALAAGVYLLVKAFNSSNEEQERQLKLTKDLNAASIEGAKNAAVERNNLDNLYKASTDQTKSLKERKEAQIELQKTYPLTFKNFTDEDFALGKAKIGYENLSKSILAASMIKAKQGLLDKEAMAFAEGEQERLNEIAEAETKLEKVRLLAANDKSGRAGVVLSDMEKDFKKLTEINKKEEDLFKAKNATILGDLAKFEEDSKLIKAEGVASKEKEVVAEKPKITHPTQAELNAEAAAKTNEDFRRSQLSDEEKQLEDFAALQKVYLDNGNITEDEYNQKIIDKRRELYDAVKSIDVTASEELKVMKSDDAFTAIQIAQFEADEKIRINAEEKEKTQAKNKEAAKIAMDLAVTSIAGLQTLSDLAFASKLSKTKKGSKEEEEVMRKQFKANKALNLSTAIINAAQAQLSILAQYPKFDGGFAMVAAMVGAGITSLASIAKIAATQFDTSSVGGNEPPPASPPPNLNAAAATATSNSQPSTLLNPDGTVANQNTPTPAPIQVYVVESDITSTQTQVAVVQNQMNFQ
jgi:hypothetical protein